MRPPQRCNPFRAPRCALSPSRVNVPRRGMRGACRAAPHPPAIASSEREMRSHLATAGTLSHRGERVRALAPRVALLPTGEGSRVGVGPAARPDAERAAGHRGAPAGDNSALPENSPARQTSDRPRLPALPTPSTKKTCPHRPRRRHPRPAFCPDEASSGGADDGREGGSPGRAASPAKPQGRRRDSRPFGPSRRYRAGGSRCARSIARRARGAGGRGHPPCRSGERRAKADLAGKRPEAAGRQPCLPAGETGQTALDAPPASCPPAPDARTRRTTNAAVKRREARRLACGPRLRPGPDA
jgi:hypothetical protein